MNILERFSLKGKVALVTAGAGPLFGASISEALAEAGATLVTASRSLDRNLEYARKLRNKGYDAHGMAVDIGSEESIKRLQGELLSRFGRLDILVNSALARVGGNFETQTANDWRHSAEGDMIGLFMMCKGFVMQMVKQGGGSVINISSIYGIVANDPFINEYNGVPHPPHYDFVKAGMVNFTRYIATNYARKGIRANCISPGGYFDHQPQAFVDAYCARAPIGRMLDREDIQGAVVFLASDASMYVNGANLVVDGGWTAL